jgi:hypothetical protein
MMDNGCLQGRAAAILGFMSHLTAPEPDQALLAAAVGCADEARRLMELFVTADAEAADLAAVAALLTEAASRLAPPLVLRHLKDRVEGTCILSRVYEGPRGFAHGGVCALLMDEICAQVPELVGVERVTTRLSVRFMKPVPLSRPLLLAGRRRTGEADLIDAAIALAERPEEPLVEAEGRLVRLRPNQIERFRRLSGDAIDGRLT